MKKGITLLTLLISIYWAQEGARYLVITYDSFYNEASVLAKWKQEKGIKTIVKRLSEVGSTPNEIRSYIINAYNTWTPRPEFLLLVGSPNLLPPYTNRSDNEYGDMVGDYRAELAVGRFPCKNAFQCSVMVQKTLSYEKTPFIADSLWFKSLLTIVRDDYDSDDTIYYNDVRYVRDWALGAGFCTIDSLSRARNHNQNDIINSINQGKGFALYRGSAAGNWWYPFYVNPAQANNGTKLPVIVSATCATVTLAPGESMVGEAWLKAGNLQGLKGAVGFFGNTRSDYNVAHLRSAIAQGFFKGVFLESLPTLGQAVLRAKQELYERYGHAQEYQCFTLLGDPELNLWTATPKLLNVSYPTYIPCLSNQFQVRVNQNGIGEKNARVCLWKVNDFYLVGYTDSAGIVSFEVNPTSVGGFLITVTKRNCLPFQDSAWVISGDCGVLEIVNLPSQNDSGQVVIPQALVKNFSRFPCNFSVQFSAENYVSTRQVTNLMPDSTALVVFDSWVLVRRGENICRCSTALAGDSNPANDFIFDTTFVCVYDVGLSQILSPTDTVWVGDTVRPTLMIHNFGNTQENFPVRFLITTDSEEMRGNREAETPKADYPSSPYSLRKNLFGDSKGQSPFVRIIYEESLQLSLAPDCDTLLIFPEWYVTEPGDYYAIGMTMLVSDMNKANDSLQKSVLAIPLSSLKEKGIWGDGVWDLNCYPNPFLNQTVIKCFGNLSRSKETRLKIYDLSGKVVRIFRLMSGTTSSVLWDGKGQLGRDLNQGIYFIQTEADSAQVHHLIKKKLIKLSHKNRGRVGGLTQGGVR
jgi:hypothetical protein